MKLSTSLVAVKKITCSKPRLNFSEDELEKAAELILKSEGVINPIIIRRTSLQSYEVVDGGFEYYAAVRAREIDPLKGEMIGAFIIEPENEEALLKQVNLFRKSESEGSHKTKSEGAEKTTFSFTDMEKFLTNLESRFEIITNKLLEQATINAKLENEIKELKKQLAYKIEPLEVFRKLDRVEMVTKLVSAGINPKRADQLAGAVIQERDKEQFKSLNDVVERVKVPRGKKMVRGVSSETMLDIVNQWSKN